MSTIDTPKDHQRIYRKATEIAEEFAKGDAFEEGDVGGFAEDWFVFMVAREIVPISDTSGPLPRSAATEEISDLQDAVRLLCRGGEHDFALALQGIIRARVLAEIALPLAYAMDEDPDFTKDFKAFDEERYERERKAVEEARKTHSERGSTIPAHTAGAWTDLPDGP